VLASVTTARLGTKIPSLVPRSRIREVANIPGLSARSVLGTCASTLKVREFGSTAGLIAVSYFLNPLCFYLSPLALAVICFYSLTKRFTDYTHVFLGLALALAPMGAWLAVKGANISTLDLVQMLVLAAAVVLWLLGFDIIYALQDYEFDRKHGLRSLVVAWGPKNALHAAFLSHMVMCGLLFAFGLLCRFRVAYTIGWLLIVGCLVLEHWIARRRSLTWINVAFFRLNAVVSMVFLVVTVAEVVFQGGFKLRRGIGNNQQPTSNVQWLRTGGVAWLPDRIKNLPISCNIRRDLLLRWVYE
jgi:4-hydroxybenzoate polyprenyltransferase